MAALHLHRSQYTNRAIALYSQGLISVVLGTRPFLQQFPEIDPEVTSAASFYKGLMTAMLELGAFLGAVQSGWTSDKISRRKTLFVGIIWFMVGSILQVSAYSYGQLVVGRLIGGVGVGTLAAVAPMYIAETAPPSIRGALLVTESWMVVFGVVVAYYVSYGSRNIPNDWCFRIPFLVQMTPAIILGGLFVILPYSPRWLCKAQREEEAHATIARLRRRPEDHPLVLAEFITIKADSDLQRAHQARKHPDLVGQTSIKKQLQLELASWADCFKGDVIKRSHIAIGLGFWQQLLGINAMIYYGPSLFEALGLDREMQLHMSGVMNLGQLVGVTPAFFLLDAVGRRPLLIFGSSVIVVVHSVVAALIGTYADNWQANRAAAWTSVGLIIAYMPVFGVSWTSLPWAIPAEMFDLAHRAKGTALGTCSIWAWNFVVGLITPALVDTMNGAGVFIFFAVFAGLSLVWTIFFVPETKGKTLEAIDELFHDSTAKETRHLEVECLERVCDEVRLKYGLPARAMPTAKPEHISTSDEKQEKEDGLVTQTVSL